MFGQKKSTVQQSSNSAQSGEQVLTEFVQNLKIYCASDEIEAEVIKSVFDSLRQILDHDVVEGYSSFVVLNTIAKQYSQSQFTLKQTLDTIFAQVQLDNPDFSVLVGPSVQLQQLISESVIRYLAAYGLLVQFLQDLSINNKILEKFYRPTALLRSPQLCQQLLSALRDRQFAPKTHFHPAFFTVNPYEALVEKLKKEVYRLPSDQLLTSDRLLTPLIESLQEVFIIDTADIIKLFNDLAAVLDNLQKDRAHISPEIAPFIQLQPEHYQVLTANIEGLGQILQMAGHQQRTGHVNFGQGQHKLLLIRFLLSQPLIFTLFAAGLAGLLEDKPMMHVNFNKTCREECPLRSGAFCAQLTVILMSYFQQKKIVNVHHLAAAAAQSYNALIDQCLGNQVEGHPIICYKVFKLSKFMSGEFNIVYFYQMAHILQRIFKTASFGSGNQFKVNMSMSKTEKSFLKDDIQKLCNQNIRPMVDAIQECLGQLQLSEDEYDWAFLFGALNQGIFDQIFKLNYSQTSDECFLNIKENCDYLFRHANVAQNQWLRKQKNKQQFDDNNLIQKDRMMIHVLTFMQEVDAIAKANFDIIDGSFIGVIFEQMEDSMHNFKQMVSDDIFNVLQGSICKQYNFKYVTQAVEYTQIYEEDMPQMLLESLNQLKRICQTHKATEQQMRSIKLSIEILLQQSATQSVWQILTNHIEEEVNAKLFSLIQKVIQNEEQEDKRLKLFQQLLIEDNCLGELALFAKALRQQLKQCYDIDAWMLNPKVLEALQEYQQQNQFNSIVIDEEQQQEMIIIQTKSSPDIQSPGIGSPDQKQDSIMNSPFVVPQQDLVVMQTGMLKHMKNYASIQKEQVTIEQSESDDSDSVAVSAIFETQQDGRATEQSKLKNQTIVDQILPHQTQQQLSNKSPFANCHILKENLNIKVDICKTDSHIDQITAEVVIDIFFMEDEEKQNIMTIEACSADNRKQELTPMRQAKKKAKFTEEWAPPKFEQTLAETMRYIAQVYPNHSQPFSMLAEWDEYLQTKQSTGQYCSLCSKPIDSKKFVIPEEAELSVDVDLFVERTPVLCAYTARWLCYNCSEGRRGFMSLQPKNLNGQRFVTSAKGLSELYKFWELRTVNQRTIKNEVRAQFQSGNHGRQAIINQNSIVQNCQSAQYLIGRFLFQQGNFDPVMNFSEYIALFEHDLPMKVNYEGWDALNAIFVENPKNIKKYQDVSNEVENGNLVDRCLFLQHILLLHYAKCNDCALRFLICPECKKSIPNESGFEFLLKLYVEGGVCQVCFKPVHKKCLKEHSCKK